MNACAFIFVRLTVPNARTSLILDPLMDTLCLCGRCPSRVVPTNGHAVRQHFHATEKDATAPWAHGTYRCRVLLAFSMILSQEDFLPIISYHVPSPCVGWQCVPVIVRVGILCTAAVTLPQELEVFSFLLPIHSGA